MTKSTITRERLQEIAEDGFLKHGESKELARMALAAMDGEPVAWTDEEELRDANESGSGYLFGIERDANKFADPRRQIMLYRHAQPAPVTERDPIAWLNDAYLARGVVDGEAGSEDAGPGYIPVYREAQPAPVVPLPDVVSVLLNHLEDVLPDDAFNLIDVKAWNAVSMLTCPDACRAAMLQSEPVTTANKLPPNSFTDDELEGMAHGDNPQSNAYRELLAYRRNYPVIPDGYVMVPKEPTGKQWAAGVQAFDSGMDKVTRIYKAMLAAAPREVR